MADNTTLNAGTGGDTIASDDIAGVKYQRVKMVLGADGVNDGDVSSANPVPVTITDASVAVTGTFWQATQPVSGTFWQATQPVSGTVAVSNSSFPVTDNGGALTVDNGGTFAVQATLQAGTAAFGKLSANDGVDIGDVTINNASIAVTGTFWQATQPVSLASLPALAAGTNNIGDVDVLTLPATAGTAASTINSTSSDGGTALTSTAQAIKASAGTLYGYYIYNPNAAAMYVQFYNTAQGSVTVGTTNPLFMITIPAASAANLWMQPGGVTFGTAMSWSATSTAGGNGAPTTALDAVCWYA